MQNTLAQSKYLHTIMPMLLEYLFAYPKSGGRLEIEIFQHAYAS